MNIQPAERMNHIKPSVIRQFAEAALKQGLISFANGNPSPVTFPVEYMKRFYQEALETGDNKLFTYGAVLGYPPLVEALKKRLAAKYGFDFEQNDLFIVSGGTQAVDLVSKIWLEKGDGVIVEEPSYSSCYNIFHAYEAELLGVGINESGIDTEAVEEMLKTHPEVKLIYTISSFQNPTGYTAVADTRKKLYELACRYDKIILEDDPYTELRFAGESVDPVKSLDTEGRVFYTSSLSKVICPSFRLGYLVADRRFRQYLNVCKQVTDIHSNTLAQYVAWGIMTKTDYEEHLNRAREEYRKRVALVTETLKKNMHPSCRISAPEGGLFMMLFMPDCVDAVEFTWKGIERGVVCVPGSGFLIDGNAPSHSIRMCYSTAPIEDVARGAEIIGKLTWDMIEGKD